MHWQISEVGPDSYKDLGTPNSGFIFSLGGGGGGGDLTLLLYTLALFCLLYFKNQLRNQLLHTSYSEVDLVMEGKFRRVW
jgi:hypothetical protein